MERCPHCGTPGRPGAKFCTTCGFQFPDAETDTVSVAVADDTPETTDSDRPANDSEWPAAPSSVEPFFGTGWDQNTSPTTAVSEPDGETAETTEIVSAERPVDPWPAPPDTVAEPDAAAPLQEETQLFGEDAAPIGSIAELEQADSAQTLARARQLLDELRETIDGIERGGALDLSGVVSDLEVAVTPPGAMAPEDVAELREALLAARERPRDVDTIVDLTKRIEAMLSLVIAYDRTIAAIERSLDVLRRGS